MNFLSCAPISLVVLYRLLMGEEANTAVVLTRELMRNYRIELEILLSKLSKEKGIRKLPAYLIRLWINRELGHLRIAEDVGVFCVGTLPR